MIQPEELRSATDKALYGLTADESLKQRILLKASQTTQSNRDSFVFRPVLKLCAIVGVLLLMVVALNSVRPLSPSAPGEMNVFAAGGKDTTGTLFSQIDVDSVSGVSVGSIDYADKAQCVEMIRVLQSEARETDTDIPADGEKMIIRMKDGTEHLFYIREPYVYKDDKCWTCAGLFAFLQK